VTKKQIWSLLAIAALGCFVFLAGPRTNPEVVREVAWDSLQTQELFVRACLDCHSHETVWPWYSHVGPVSWLVIHDVLEGREKFNISGARLGEAGEAAAHVREGKMPPAPYTWLHPAARLTAEERQQLSAGLAATFGESVEEEEDDD